MPETTLESLLDAVEEIAPVLREHSARSEEQRCLAEPIVEAMTGVGLYRVWIPKIYGGMEADPITGLQMFEAVARIDSAAAWNLMLSAGGALFGQFFPNGLDEWFSKPKGIFLNPPGKAVPVDGGYRVTSRTPFRQRMPEHRVVHRSRADCRRGRRPPDRVRDADSDRALLPAGGRGDHRPLGHARDARNRQS